MSNVMPLIQASSQHSALVELVKWIDKHTVGLTLPTDERAQLAIGCFDVALEHQRAIALLYSAGLPGSMLALLRVIAESLVRGLWLHACATESQLQKFKKGKLDKKFDLLVTEYEEKIGTPNGVLSIFKLSAYKQMNDFTHTGFLQVSRRHAPGLVGPNYPDEDVAKALGVAGVLGLIAAAQIVGIAGQQDLLSKFNERMSQYTRPA